MAKKNYTYNSKGELVFVKDVRVENLPKGTNYEIKANYKKPAISVKGIYSF